MKLEPSKLKALARGRNLRLGNLLRQAGVSRTAYYSLVRKDNVLPRSLQSIAERLGVTPTEFLVDPQEEVRQMQVLQRQVSGLVRKYPKANPDNLRHTLLLLREEPMKRLQRSLLRAQKFNFYRPRS